MFLLANEFFLVDGKFITDKKQIHKMLAGHFEELSTPSENIQFDIDFLTCMTANVQKILPPALMTHQEYWVDLFNMRRLHEFARSWNWGFVVF